MGTGDENVYEFELGGRDDKQVVELASERLTTVRLHRRLLLRVLVIDCHMRPCAGEDYKIEADGQVYEGTISDEGLIEQGMPLITEVATLTGRIRVRIPAGSSTGKKIRLAGKGLANAGVAGDLIAELRVVVPTELSDEERDLYQQLSDVSSFHPRAENGAH